MSQKIAKRIRKEMFVEIISTQAEPYTINGHRQVFASSGRRLYQKRKGR